MVWPNRVAIREGISQVPEGASVLTTANYASHLSHRRWIEMIPKAPVSTLEPQADAIFLNLKDVRWWGCDDYFDTLKASAELNFGIIFYRDGVVLAQRDRGDKNRLKSLLAQWPGCKQVGK